jgi:hypothetical protein
MNSLTLYYGVETQVKVKLAQFLVASDSSIGIEILYLSVMQQQNVHAQKKNFRSAYL